MFLDWALMEGAMAIRASVNLVAITSAAAAAIGFSVIKAQAGGIFLHAQSAYFMGTSWAGVAAGGPSASAMFWNPATITQQGLGLTTEVDAAVVFPHTDISPIAATSPTGVSLVPFGRSGNLSGEAFIPSSYYVYGLNNWISFGLAVNSPFGLKTDPNPLWAGMFRSHESSVFTLNATPTLAFKLADWLSVGAGAQIEYFKAKLYSAFPGSGATGPFPLLAPIAPDELRIDGDSWDVGFTAGVTITPTPWTTIGVGYRSRIDHGIEGDIFRPAFVAPVVVPPFGLIPVGFPAAFVNFTATVPLPDIATASIRQKITESFTLLATVEWENWSRLGRIPVTTNPPGPIPGIPTQFAFEWRDGWLVSGGVEYQWTAQVAVRAGIGWERSPVTDRNRETRLPDADRLWVGAGATYKWNEQLWLDFAYSHIFFDDAAINLTAASGNPAFNPGTGSFVGTANAQVDFLSVALRYRFFPLPAPVVTKG
jgi:long-chain fatty acid transport protein